MTTATLIRLPERSYRQRIDALQHANEIRTYRAQLKRDVKFGVRSVDWLLLEPPAQIATMKVLDLLLAAPKVGRVKATKALSKCKISPSKTIAGMTVRQRKELLERLTGG